MSKTVHLLLTLLLLSVVLPIGAQDRVDAARGDGELSAWDDYLARHPGAADDVSIGPLERKVLDALRPDQAEAFFGGADPRQIVLDDGETLAAFLAGAIIGGQGLVYVPVDQCRLFSTAAQTAPVTGRMAAGEIREFVARGAGTAHTDQGGVVDCAIPIEAVAVVIHFRVAATPVQGAAGFLKAWSADDPEPATRVVDYEPGVDPPMPARVRFNGTAVVELCPAGSCATGEFKVKTAALEAHVRGDVAGFFRPIVVSDVPGAGNADTLDGFDSTYFAMATHTHDGGDIVSGTVGEPYIDPLIARDDEIVDLVKANDGSGSGLDADLFDGKELTAFRPRPANVIIVDPTDGDFASIQAALDAIGVDPRFPAATTTNRYLIKVGIGTYAEQVTMKPFVDIEGKGTKATKITAPSQTGVGGAEGTLECADDAEIRQLTIESTGGTGGEKAIAIRCAGAAPMLTHVKATAMGADPSTTTPENIGVLNDGAAATPMLTQVAVYAGNTVASIGVRNQNGASPTIRDSSLSGSDAAIENRDTATAKVANTALAGGAEFEPPAIQSSYMCVRAYNAGTLVQLNAECFPNTPPIAVSDSYATLGNTLIEVTLDHAGAASTLNTTATQPSVIGETTTPKTYRSVFENDTDAESAKSDLTAAVVGGTVTAGAVVNVFADGTFEYTPPAGFTGADTFDYTVTDPGGLADTGTVTVNVSSLIWYVDNSNGGTADGRSTTPYASLAPIDAGGGDDAKDGAGDTIFVFTGSGSTGDGILLEANQVLQGNEIALAPAGFEYAGGGNLVAAGTAPSLGNAAGDVVELASGNTVRGLDIAATAGLAITGNGVAGVTLDEVGIGGTGTGNGVLFDGVTGTIAMTDLDVNSSTNWGVAIQSSSATFTFDAASSITNPTGVAISVVSGAPNVTYSGAIANNSGVTINVSGTTGGTVLFDGSSINGDSSSGILLTSVGGNVTVDAATTTLNNSATSAISIQSASSGTFRFDDVTIMSPTGSGIDINGGAGDALTGTVDFNNVDVTSASASPAVSIVGLGAAAGGVDFDTSSAITSTNGGISITSNGGGAIAFNGPVDLDTAGLAAVNATSNTGATINFAGLLDIDTTSGTGFNVTGGTVNVDSSTQSTTVDTGTGIGVNIGAGIGATGVTFDTVNVNGSSSGILLANTGTGTFSVTSGTIQNTTSRSFSAANVDGVVSIGASLENNGGRTVEIVSGSAGAFAFAGAIDENALGIEISSNAAAATFTFQGGVDIDTIAGHTGFNAFSGGTLAICADTNCDGGGTALVNTIDTTLGTGTAIGIDGVTIGTAGVTFQSIDVDDGSGPAIRLDTTGAGAFTVTGIDGPCGKPGASDCDGGTLSNIAGDAIQLEDTDGPVSLSYMLIQDIGSTSGAFDTLSGHDAIHGQSVDGGLTLDNVTIRRISDMGINGTLFSPGGGDPTTAWNGLTITDSHIANTNRFDPALTTVADDSDEGGVRILGLRGTTLLDGNVFERGGTLAQLFVTSGAGPLPATTTITVTENDFKEAYKEFSSGGTLSKGITCLDVIAQDTGNVDLTVGSRTDTTVGHQTGDDGNLFLNCHGASLRYGNDSVSAFGLPAATGDVDAVVGNNTFQSTDHDSAQSGDFDFPRGYLLAITRGTDTATFDTRISYNLFDEVSFEGGLGQLNLDFEDGIHQAKVDFNTFDSPGHAPWFVRGDSSASAEVLFRDNTGIRGPFCSGDPSAAGGGCDLGGGNLCTSTPENPSAEGYCGPGESATASVQNLADLDMGIIDDTFALEDAFYTIGETVRIRTVNTGGAGTICAYLEDNTSPNGYGLEEDGGTLELEQGGSASTDPATVLGDNNNTGAPKTIIGGVTVTTGSCIRPTGSIFN